MIIYNKSKKEFVEDVFNGDIENILRNSLKELINVGVSTNEYNSWKNSLQHMYMILDEETIPDNLGISIEYNLPRSSKRIDFIISGYKGDIKNLLIIELKQWETCTKILGSNSTVRTFLGKGVRETVHPSYQVFSYGQFLKDYSSVVYDDKNLKVHTCAFLHNYVLENAPDILDEQYRDYTEESPLFFKSDKGKMQKYIMNLFGTGDEGLIMRKIEEGGIRPGKSIQKFIKDIIDGDSIFTLLDDQKVCLEKAIRIIKKSKKDGKKRVLVIPGGPGTGKTVIALRMLSKCLQDNMNSIYVTKNSAVRDAYKKIILDNNEDKKYTKSRIDNLFVGAAKFSNLNQNKYDVSIVDEAHRLIDRHQYTKAGTGYDNQIQEIICESLVSIFFIDEKQQVTLKDMGTIDEIKNCSRREGLLENDFKIMEVLQTQFRSSGADEYIKFVNNFIYNENDYVDYSFLEKFDLKIFDDPNEMYENLKSKNVNNESRMLAGYCWNWNSKKDDKINDIKIGSFEKKWNLANDKTWAISADSFEEVGCVHTSQGLEFDYAGLIIGKDLIYKDGRVETDFTQRANTDNSLKGIKNIAKISYFDAKNISDPIIRNTYNVLLTRGMKGCYIYVEDDNLRKYLKSKISN